MSSIQELQKRSSASSAQPSATSYVTDRVTYPVIDPPQLTPQPAPQAGTAVPLTQRRSRRYGLPEGDDEDDWEPQGSSDDWEGVEAPQNVESQGGRLMGLEEVAAQHLLPASLYTIIFLPQTLGPERDCFIAH